MQRFISKRLLIRIVLTLGVGAGVFALLAPLTAQDRGGPRIVMISIDGMMPSSYTKPTAKIPNLQALAGEGVWAEGVVGVFPTVTYPSHTTLITGVTPAVHGIVDNRILDPEGKSNGAWFYYARDIKAPTLPMAARAKGLRAAGVNWPVTVGMDLDFVTPEYIRTQHIENLSMLRALSWPRNFLEGVETTRGKPFGWPQTDRDRTDIALFTLKTFDPHVLLLHLIELDGAEHANGPASPEAIETLSRMDGYVGEIVAAIKSSGRADRTNIAVVSDHGFLATKTMLQPNAAFKKEGLLTVDDRGRITEWQAYFHSSGGAGFVYLKDPSLTGRVQKIIDGLKSDPANGIRNVWNRSELAAKGAHPDAAFGLDFVDGFYGSDGNDVLIKPSTSKGGHGFDPERPALHASFIMAGPDVKKRGSLGVVRMTQIAPTMASILGVGLSPAAGTALDLGAAKPATGSR